MRTLDLAWPTCGIQSDNTRDLPIYEIVTLSRATHETGSIHSNRLQRAVRSICHPGLFLRNIGTLVTGTVFSQFLLIAVSPILTRLYSPDDYGKLALFSGVAAILSIFSTMRYHYAIVIAKDEVEAATLFELCIRISVLIATCSMLGILSYEACRVVCGFESKLGWVVFLIPIAVVSNGFAVTLSNMCNRRRAYKAIARGAIAQSSSSSSFNLILGYISPSGLILISGAIVAQLANCLVLGRGLLFAGTESSAASWWRYSRGIRRHELLAVAKKYSKFPKFDIWTDLANVGSIQFPVLLIVAFFTDSFAGFFLLSQRIVGLPMTFLGTAIGQVFYRYAHDMKDSPDKMASLLKRIYRANLLIGLVPTLILICWGDVLFAFVFGNEWRDAGILASFLAPAFMFQFIASPLSSIFWVDQKQEQTMRFCVLLLTGRILAIFIPAIMGCSFFVSAGFFGLVGCILWLGFCLFILEHRNISLAGILIETATAIILGGLFGYLTRWLACETWRLL